MQIAVSSVQSSVVSHDSRDAGVGDLTLVTVACPLCQSPDWKRLRVCSDLLYGVPGEFQFVRCANCSHVYMNPRPTVADLPRCYPGGYVPHQAYRESVSPQRSPWYLSRGVRRIPGLRALYYWLVETRSAIVPSQVSPGRALEIGCGRGDFLEQLARAGQDVYGVEPAPTAAEIARQRGFHVHTGTLESASLASGGFDAAFAWMVVEHLPEPRVTLSEIHRVLAPDGRLFFSVPNHGCWEPRAFGRFWAGYDAPRHLQQFTPHSLRRLLDECGFTVERIIHQTSPLYPLGSLGLWLRSRFPRCRIGSRLVDAYLQNPPLWVTLMLAPLAKLQALLRQSGRLTVIARRREATERLEALDSQTS